MNKECNHRGTRKPHYLSKQEKEKESRTKTNNIPNKPLYKIVQRRVQSPSKQFLTSLHVRIREYV